VAEAALFGTCRLYARGLLGVRVAVSSATSGANSSRTAAGSSGEDGRSTDRRRYFNVAGIPQALAPVGISRFTSDIAPITTPSPIVTPFSITHCGPI